MASEAENGSDMTISVSARRAVSMQRLLVWVALLLMGSSGGGALGTYLTSLGFERAHVGAAPGGATTHVEDTVRKLADAQAADHEAIVTIRATVLARLDALQSSVDDIRRSMSRRGTTE